MNCCLLVLSVFLHLLTEFNPAYAPVSDASIAACMPLDDSVASTASCSSFESILAAGQSTETEHWFLMNRIRGTVPGDQLAGRGIEIYGWTEGSFTVSSANRRQLPFGFNFRANDFLLNQNWLRVVRKVDLGSSQATFGFLSDTILPGSDYRFTLARGLANGQSGSHGIDPVQFHVQASLPDIGNGTEIKAGRFFGQYGVESIAAIDTPFLSRAYNFIYNPFTHTGILATTTLDENWTIQNGIVTGSDVFFDSAAAPAYVGSIKWIDSDQRSSLLLATIFGSGRFDVGEDFDNPRVFDLVFTREVNTSLTYKLDALYGYQTGISGIGTAQWYAFVQYLTRQWTDRLSSTARLEFFDDIDGNRTGFEGLYTALTAGMDFRPFHNLILRPELRYDHNNRSRPFEDKSTLFTAAIDLIVRW